MEETKAKEICVKRRASFSRASEDMISELPESLISQILSYLPTKEAVKTGVWSNRWKSLWLLIPGLDLDSSDFPCYKSFERFIDRFLDFTRKEKSCLHKLKLRIANYEDTQPFLTRWIDFVATGKLKHLDVQCLRVERECLEVMPLSLYICETLLYLRLHRVSIGSFECVSLPCVKTMRLENNVYVNDACLESLISSCPVLEDLSFLQSRSLDDNVKILRVHSQTLTSLSIEVDTCRVPGFDYENSGLIIDAPRLKHLDMKNHRYKNKTISNPGSLTSVNILGNFCWIDSADEVNLRMLSNFFTSISGLRNMQISWQTFQGLRSCLMSRNMRLTTAPRCLLSSLESVEIKHSNSSGDVSVDFSVEVAMYFAENSVILKKLVLRLGYSLRPESSEVLRDLMASMRRSSTCQIVVC
ncbi:unnamed protein product [Microthlaspi erraticum]|uniref:F-box domain-containing protein n=1 Tax=Microthlaspi erraticum TaxID=1685480 RepID=A0A6D2HJ08_9BRAS|nr:unnamed protein product [Microthlaspi erraticum]CAA7054253.1 unnamed protein product [Microthlaspi erraticum]